MPFPSPSPSVVVIASRSQPIISAAAIMGDTIQKERLKQRVADIPSGTYVFRCE